MKTALPLALLTLLTLAACGGPSGVGIGKDSQRSPGTISSQPTPKGM